MEIKEYLELDFFTRPWKISNEGFGKYLESNFKEYLNSIDLISDENLKLALFKQKANIEIFCNSILSSIVNHQKGYTSAAYLDFKTGIDLLKPFLFPEDKGIISNVVGLHKPFYRSRIDKNRITSKSQMFHLPFSKKELSTTQRFSNPGLPCLYLSNSIYVSWEELNRPPINEVYVSRFQQENFSLNILDISLTPKQVEFYYEATKDAIKDDADCYDKSVFRYLNIWPLSFICSLIVDNENASFKQEYIFPQFLLQWVTSEKDVDGIKYSSVKSNSLNKEDYTVYVNYVFPPKKIEQADFCTQLTQSFKLTEPVSFETLNVTDPNSIFMNKKWIDNLKYKVMIDVNSLELIKGYKMLYTDTIFGKMEMFLSNLEIDFMFNKEII